MLQVDWMKWSCFHILLIYNCSIKQSIDLNATREWQILSVILVIIQMYYHEIIKHPDLIIQFKMHRYLTDIQLVQKQIFIAFIPLYSNKLTQFNIIFIIPTMSTFIKAVKISCKGKIESYLRCEDMPPPFVFFLAFVYFHSGIETPLPQLGNTLFFFGCFLVFACNFNFLFTMAPFVNCTSKILSIFMFVVCALACNEKWKAYIFLLTIGDSLIADALSNSTFMALACAYFCFEAYRGLIFKTVSDNMQFFAIFFAVGVFNSTRIIFINVEHREPPPWFTILTACIMLHLGYRMMQGRIEALKKTDIAQISNPRLMAFHLQLLEISINEYNFVCKTKVAIHKQKCTKLECFCHNPSQIDAPQYFMRTLYENAIRNFGNRHESLLTEDYCKFLLRHDQMINALHYLSSINPQSYFMMISRIRMEGVMKHRLSNLTSSNPYEKEYLYALQYDRLCQSVAIQINDVLQLKIRFWGEVCCEAPLMFKLQKDGRQIIDRMYDLNQFYCRTCKAYEKKLYSFDATVLYGMYLLSTTNFKQYAETIIKNTSTLLEDVEIWDNKIAETFCVSTQVHNSKKIYLQHEESIESLFNKRETYSSKGQYKLIIDAVCSSFCKLIKCEKRDLLGKDLNTIIPQGYREVHDTRLKYLLDFDGESLTQIIGTKVLHRVAQLPIRGSNNELYMGFTCIKTVIDIEKGLLFMSTIRKMNGKTKTALMNFNDEITEKEDGFNTDLLEHSEVRKYISNLKESWQNNRAVKEESFNIMMNSTNYGITISSPLLIIFLEKRETVNQPPPIHIQVLNEELNKLKKFENKYVSKIATQLKHIQNVIVNTDAESTAASTKNSTFSVKVLQIFAENNSVSVYRYIQIVFLVVIGCCLGANLSNYLVADLEWDNTRRQNNPVTDIIRGLTLKLLNIKSLHNVDDFAAYKFSGINFNATRVNDYQPTVNFAENIYNIENAIFEEFKTNLYECIANKSDLLKVPFDTLWNTVINAPNFGAINEIQLQSQNVTYLQLMLNYAVDVNLFSKGKVINNIIMYSTYNSNVTTLQSMSSFNSYIDDSINRSKHKNIILQVALTAIILILIIPLAYFLRKRAHIHEKVFDLIVSIDAALVTQQINSLQYILNILRNYEETSEVLKMNVLSYKENIKLTGHHDERRFSAVNNEIVIGLQKYDKNYASLQQNYALRGPTKKKTDRKHSINRSLKKMSTSIKSRTSTKQQNNSSIQRRRAGELDLTGSECDRSKWIIGKHWFIYLTIIMFTVFLAVYAVKSNDYMQNIRSRKDAIQSIITQFVSDSLKFLNGRLYLRTRIQDVKSQYTSGMAYSYLLSFIPQVPVYNYLTDSSLAHIEANCTIENSILGPKTAQKYCEFNYSYVLLYSQYFSLLKQLFQTKNVADANYKNSIDNNKTQIYNQIIGNISEKLFYMQSQNNILQNMTLNMLDSMVSDMQITTKDFNSIKSCIFFLSLGWFVISFTVGITLIWGMKKQYLKEAYMITFLSNDMLFKNKRVESFLESLTKNNN